MKWIDIPTLLIASVVLDIEPILILMLNLPFPLHGLLHSFLGGFLASIILIIVMKDLRGYISPIMDVVKIKQNYTIRSISIGAFLGTISHVLLDTPIYEDMNPFFPYIGNPLLIDSNMVSVYISIICIYCFIGALFVYLFKLTMYFKKQNIKLANSKP